MQYLEDDLLAAIENDQREYDFHPLEEISSVDQICDAYLESERVEAMLRDDLDRYNFGVLNTQLFGSVTGDG
jgi:RIO-like serine/threonine protein kinase